MQYLDFPTAKLRPEFFEKEDHYEEYLSFQLHNDSTEEYALSKIRRVEN